MDEEGILSILRGREGCYDKDPLISDFKQHFNEAALANERFYDGWVLWNEQHLDVQHKIITLLKHIASNNCLLFDNYLVQFWAVVKVEGSHHYLSTSHQPFHISNLRKGNSWYRQQCMDHVYNVDMEKAEAEAEQQLGGVGRAYRNKRPESTPDLRLYSSNEFSLRDEAARWGFIAYLALPIFDIQTYECYGVLELLSVEFTLEKILVSTEMDLGLQIAGLRSTHMPLSSCTNKMVKTGSIYTCNQQPHIEIKEILELAIKAVPQLSLAQVWVPCNQCATNICCMEQASFITAHDKILNQCSTFHDQPIFEYLEACEFHKLQLHDLGISKNPLAHYIQRARLSLPLIICLQSINNSSPVIIEYFLKYREDYDSSVKLLLRIMGMKLKSFEFVLEELEGFRSRQYNAIECEAIEMLKVMDSCVFLQQNFVVYLETSNSCCSRPTSKSNKKGWVFSPPGGEGLYESDTKGKLLHFMKQIAAKFVKKYSMVQFWAPKMVGDRYCLLTSDQPYALGCLQKGLASFRKKCIQHLYFVDDKSKEEELGPPGRVFRNGNTEAISDLSFYSTKEFLLRNYALHCGFTDYSVLPVFDEHKHNCIGVLEFIGCSYFEWREIIRKALKKANLSAIHIDRPPSLFFKNNPNNDVCKRKALTELRDAMSLFKKMPQCYMVDVWIHTDGKYFDSKLRRCMTRESCTEYNYAIDWIHVESGMGLIGMVLDSESKSCFCSNICEFSIAHQPLAPFYRKHRCSACFAICLQSSHTGELLYVVHFFLNQDPATYQNLRCFLNFLLAIMRLKFKSFKIATGKQLGEELVVEVIQFSEANQLTSSNSEQLDVFPITFKSVRYGRNEDLQYIEDEQVQASPNLQYIEDEQVQTSPNPQYIEDQQVQAIPNLKKAEKGKRKTNLRFSLEDLKPHFGKKLKDVEPELGVDKSTIKRACRRLGIKRWPWNEKQARNPSLYRRREASAARDQQEDICLQPSSSTSLIQRRDSNNKENTEHPVVEKVMIKVTCKEDTTKFEICLSSGVATLLLEQLSRNLNLKIGSFKLKYFDEDGDEILVTCDDDLQLCHKSHTAMGKTFIELNVQLIAEDIFDNRDENQTRNPSLYGRREGSSGARDQQEDICNQRRDSNEL